MITDKEEGGGRLSLGDQRRLIACHLEPDYIERLDLLVLAGGFSRSSYIAHLIKRRCNDVQVNDAIERIAHQVYLEWCREAERRTMTKKEINTFLEEVTNELSKKRITDSFQEKIIETTKHLIRKRGVMI